MIPNLMDSQRENLVNKNKITIYNIASTIILQGLAFISGPIFSGILGTSNYGVAAVYLAWVQIASTVFSLQAAGTIAIARANFSIEEQEKFQSSVLSLATLCYAVFSVFTLTICVIVGVRFGISFPMVSFGLAQGWGMYCVAAMNAKFTYEFKANWNFLLSVTTSVCTIGLSIILIYQFPSDTNYWGRIIGQSSVYTILGFFLLIYILRRGKTFYNKTYWSFTLPIAIPTIFHLLAMIVLNQSDKMMLQNMVNNSSAGIYSLASTFSSVLNTIYHALNNSWVPFYYEYTRKSQIKEMRKHARNYIELFTIVSMGFILLAREVFHIYAQNSFWDGTDLIPMFSIGYYFIFLYSFPVNYEFYNKKTKTIAFGTGAAALCNIILNFFLIKLWGIQGTVVATVISYGLQFAFHLVYAKRINPGEYPFMIKDFIPGFIAVCVTCIIYLFTRELWMVRWSLGLALGFYLMYKIVKRREIF